MSIDVDSVEVQEAIQRATQPFAGRVLLSHGPLEALSQVEAALSVMLKEFEQAGRPIECLGYPVVKFEAYLSGVDILCDVVVYAPDEVKKRALNAAALAGLIGAIDADDALPDGWRTLKLPLRQGVAAVAVR